MWVNHKQTKVADPFSSWELTADYDAVSEEVADDSRSFGRYSVGTTPRTEDFTDFPTSTSPDFPNFDFDDLADEEGKDHADEEGKDLADEEGMDLDLGKQVSLAAVSTVASWQDVFILPGCMFTVFAL